jgi:Leucine-rich repeat (LRR) protein
VLYYNRVGPHPAVQKSIEQLALEDFFVATNGRDWKLNFGWTTNISVCQWQGITCNDDWHVIVIDLKNNNIIGTIPASFGNLKHLTAINMNQNAITGQLPKEIFGIETLESMSFQSNNFHGTIPEEILTAKALKTINFYLNNIGGTVPNVTNMPKLVNFLFGYNNLHGQLPELTNSSSRLGFFDVRWNNISGTVPKMTSISFEIAIEHNNISGPVKEALAGLKTVKFLRLNSNRLTGEFAVNPTLSNNLFYLNISDNQFTKLTINIPFGQNLFCEAFKNLFQCPYSLSAISCDPGPCINTTTPIGS